MSIKSIIEKQNSEFDSGEFVSFSPPNWNEDNIKGYNIAKKEFFNWHTSSIQEIIQEVIKEVENISIKKEALKVNPLAQDFVFTYDVKNLLQTIIKKL